MQSDTSPNTVIPASLTNSRSLAHRLIPYLCAIVALIVAYVGTMVLTDQRILAGMLAAFATILGFIVCRLIQLRGRLTLGILVIGFPLVIAIGFTAMQRLNPFVNHQRSISMLRSSGLTIRTRAASEYGGWKQDQSDENMLPTWLANRIGPDCLSELTRIEGELAEFQSMRFSEINPSKLRLVKLLRFHESPVISPQLVEWLNRAERARVNLLLADYTDADGAALSSIGRNSWIIIDVDDFTGDLSMLHGAGVLHLRGTHLSPKQASQIATLSKTSFVFDGIPLSKETVLKFQNESWNSDEIAMMTIQSSSLDLATLEALAQLPGRLDFRELNLPRMKPIEFDSKEKRSRSSMFVSGCNTSFKDARNLISLFRCRNLSIETVASDKEVDTLWDFPFLNSCRVLNYTQSESRKLYERPVR